MCSTQYSTKSWATPQVSITLMENTVCLAVYCNVRCISEVLCPVAHLGFMFSIIFSVFTCVWSALTKNIWLGLVKTKNINPEILLKGDQADWKDVLRYIRYIRYIRKVYKILGESPAALKQWCMNVDSLEKQGRENRKAVTENEPAISVKAIFLHWNN